MNHLVVVIILSFGFTSLASVHPMRKFDHRVGSYFDPNFLLVQKDEYPFVVSFQSPSKGGHFCTGSIIHHQWVLSAGHCFFSKAQNTTASGDVVVKYGSTDLTNAKTLEAVKFIQYPLFEIDDYLVVGKGIVVRKLAHDIALVKVKGSFGHTTPATLPPNHIFWNQGDNAVTMGWGRLRYRHNIIDRKPKDLRKIVIPVSLCPDGDGVTNGQLCADVLTESTEQGDSGGPLILYNYLLGVTSVGNDFGLNGYGLSGDDHHEQDHQYYKSTFTYVPTYVDWITRCIMNEEYSCHIL